MKDAIPYFLIGVLIVAIAVGTPFVVGSARFSTGSKATIATRGAVEGTVLYPEQILGQEEFQGAQEEETATPAREETSKVGCQCDDCQCPDPMICKNGHCQEKYAIVFSMDGCLPCIKMHPTIRSLRKQGHAIYYFHEYKTVAARYNVRLYPTTIIFDQGREVHRFNGLVNEQTIKRYL